MLSGVRFIRILGGPHPTPFCYISGDTSLYYLRGAGGGGKLVIECAKEGQSVRGIPGSAAQRNSTILAHL